ncbi:MAG: hypothetical protein GQ574_01760 [Crocinitomix sp.]|nr:hypothetical protein [Crocinitomix sp.]
MKNLKKYATGKNVIISLVATYSVYAIMILITIPNLTNYSDVLTILDLKPSGYTQEYVINLFQNLGENGRAYYLHYQLPIDFLYPLFFAISGFLTLFYFISKLKLSQSFWKWLNYLPIIAGIADYLENFGIIQLLASFPKINEAMVMTTSCFSIVKSAATTLYFLSLITLLIMTLVRRYNRS